MYTDQQRGFIWGLAALVEMGRLPPALRRERATTTLVRDKCASTRGAIKLVTLAVENSGHVLKKVSIRIGQLVVSVVG